MNTQNVDIEKMETLVCLESLVETCYRILQGLVHNQGVRRECQQLEFHTQLRQEELIKIFSLSASHKNIINNKVNDYVLKLKPLQLSMRALINVAINLNHFKLDIYKHLNPLTEEHRGLLYNFLEENMEEIDFLRQEKNFHENRLDVYFDATPPRP